MAEFSDYRLGADVVASDGRKVGTLVSVIVEEDGFDPRAIVIREEDSFAGRLLASQSAFVTDQVVVPIGSVSSASGRAIHLSISASDVRAMPPYLSYHYKRLTTSEVLLRGASVMAGGLAMPAAEQVANKAAGQIEIDQGENVMLGRSGHRLGRVHDVLFDQGEMIGIVVRPDGFGKKDLVLPVRFIDRADDMALFCHLEKSDIDRLEPFAKGE